MKTEQAKPKYVAWLSAETMHKSYRKWLSELMFIKDEQLFFNDLIKSYTLPLIDAKNFEKSKKLIDYLSAIQKRTDVLIESVKTHETDLKIMVDGINQPKEEQAYKKEHKGLIILISEFHLEYNALKTQLFKLVKSIIKTQKHLLQQ